MAETRKTDRRTVYTKQAIKDAFLRVKRVKEYDAITVADICAVLPVLPRYPVTWKLWLAEEKDKIDGSGRLFLNSSAGHCLSIEDAVTVGTIL